MGSSLLAQYQINSYCCRFRSYLPTRGINNAGICVMLAGIQEFAQDALDADIERRRKLS